MIILDTNVLSALMRPAQETAIVTWINEQLRSSIWITSITMYEIRFGLNLLPFGKRRSALEAEFEQTINEDLSEQIAPFDQQAAEEAARISAALRALGCPGQLTDIQIAGIVAAQNATLAARNTRHFENTGIDLINPGENGD